MGRGIHKSTSIMRVNIYDIAQERQPITVRGIAYQLFVRGAIESMARKNVAKVSRVATQMREDGDLPWEWIADETRRKEQVSTWQDPQKFMAAALAQYRKNFWDHQPFHVEVWSEKSTVAGVLAPILNDYAIGFRVQHGFGSATSLHEAAQESAAYESNYATQVLYVGDYDPSGLYMSEVDIPDRIERYEGCVEVHRIALSESHCRVLDLPYFPVASKATDPRYKWWHEQGYGPRCWELDAMDPRLLRNEVKEAIRRYVDPVAWERCKTAEEAEHASMAAFFKRYVA
jgi:hypothetical protein